MLLRYLTVVLAIACNVIIADDMATTFYTATADESEVQSVTSDVENVKFSKTITVNLDQTADVGIWELSIYCPGTVFVDYVERADAGASSSTLAQITASGDSDSLVDSLFVTMSSLNVGVGASLFCPNVNEGFLLIEISIFVPKFLRSVTLLYTKDGSVEVVINDGVMYSSDSESTAFSNLDAITFYTNENATLYFVPTTALNMYSFKTYTSDNSQIYVEGSAMTTELQIWLETHDSSRSFLFFDSIDSKAAQLNADDSSALCLDVSNSFDVGRVYTSDGVDHIALPELTSGIDVAGAFSCSKMSIPDRVPRDISLALTPFTLGAATPKSNSSSGSNDTMSVGSDGTMTGGSDSTASDGSTGSASGEPSSKSGSNGVTGQQVPAVAAILASLLAALSVAL